MHFWIYLFASPIAILAAILIYLVLRQRYEFRRISTWAAFTTGFAAPAVALRGFIHRNAVNLPLAFDPNFERKVWLVAVGAALFGLAWLIESRRWYSFLALLLSFLAAAFWSTVVLPL